MRGFALQQRHRAARTAAAVAATDTTSETRPGHAHGHAVGREIPPATYRSPVLSGPQLLIAGKPGRLAEASARDFARRNHPECDIKHLPN